MGGECHKEVAESNCYIVQNKTYFLTLNSYVISRDY